MLIKFRNTVRYKLESVSGVLIEASIPSDYQHGTNFYSKSNSISSFRSVQEIAYQYSTAIPDHWMAY